MPPAPSPHRDMVESAVFIHYLRTGYRPDVEELLALVERKFNPYHDQIGRFTSPPGATVSYGASLTARAASNSNDIGGHGARRTQTGPSRRNGESVPSRSRGSLNGFRSALVRDAVSPTTSNADSYFELNKRQAHLDHLRREVGPIPDPAVFADLEDFQRRLNANRQLLDDRARIADRQVNEILRAGLAPYNVASGAISIASGNGELRDYLSVAEVIPVAGTVGRLGKIATLGKVSRPVAEISTQTVDVVQLGGAYRHVRKLRGYHAHHMPANTASPLSKGQGPSVAMLPEDHVVTISYGRGTLAKAHQTRQKQLISEGKFREAQVLDIADLKRKFGSRYDRAIEEMIKHTLDKGY